MRCIYRILVHTLEWFTLVQKPRNVQNLPIEIVNRERHVDIFVVAFNKPELLEYQYQLIKKNIIDDYTYIVVDNSTDKEMRRKIETFCRENGIAYISLPKNFLNKIGGSYSHGACLNYLCHKILVKRKTKYYAFIDHDLFPIKPYSIIEQLEKQSLFGVLRDRGDAWYLWAGMSFFSSSEYAPNTMDFLPMKTKQEVYLDTGGGNWSKHFKKINLTELEFPDVEQVSIREGNDYHLDQVQYIANGSWLHCINGSCWKPDSGGGKTHIIKTLLNKHLQ